MKFLESAIINYLDECLELELYDIGLYLLSEQFKLKDLS